MGNNISIHATDKYTVPPPFIKKAHEYLLSKGEEDPEWFHSLLMPNTKLTTEQIDSAFIDISYYSKSPVVQEMLQSLYVDNFSYSILEYKKLEGVDRYVYRNKILSRIIDNYVIKIKYAWVIMTKHKFYMVDDPVAALETMRYSGIAFILTVQKYIGEIIDPYENPAFWIYDIDKNKKTEFTPEAAKRILKEHEHQESLNIPNRDMETRKKIEIKRLANVCKVGVHNNDQIMIDINGIKLGILIRGFPFIVPVVYFVNIPTSPVRGFDAKYNAVLYNNWTLITGLDKVISDVSNVINNQKISMSTELNPYFIPEYYKMA